MDTADADAEEIAADMGVGGDAPEPDDPFGLANLETPMALPSEARHLALISVIHRADGDSSYSSFDVHRLPDRTLLVTFEDTSEVIGRFDELASIRAALDLPGQLEPVLHLEREFEVDAWMETTGEW